MSEQSCPSCGGKGYNMVERAAVYHTYADGSKIPIPQTATVSQPENCSPCGGTGKIQGGSR